MGKDALHSAEAVDASTNRTVNATADVTNKAAASASSSVVARASQSVELGSLEPFGEARRETPEVLMLEPVESISDDDYRTICMPCLPLDEVVPSSPTGGGEIRAHEPSTGRQPRNNGR